MLKRIASLLLGDMPIAGTIFGAILTLAVTGVLLVLVTP